MTGPSGPTVAGGTERRRVGGPTHLVELVAPAVAAAATTWAGLFAWRGFTATPARFLVPLLLLAVLVAGLGVALRMARLPHAVVFLTQLVVAGFVAFALLTGSALPTGESLGLLRADLAGAIESSRTFRAPIPASAPGVEPLLVLGGLVCLLIVDLLACTLRRASLAGLPLLTIYTIPVSVTGEGVSWLVFVLVATGFVAMLYLEHGDNLARWGRTLGHSEERSDPSGFGVRTGAVRGTAAGIAASATALAVVLPIFIPTLTLGWLDFGRGPGDGDINIENPIADLRRDLNRGADVPLLRVSTDDPDPSYLRVAVLGRLSEEQWSTGDRQIPQDQAANGLLPPLQGVDESLPRRLYDYEVSATGSFDSIWLPTADTLADVTAPGDWRYDLDTIDFLAGDDGTTTSGTTWRFTKVDIQRNALAMARAPAATGAVSQEFSFVPGSLPPVVRDLAREIGSGLPTRFQRAVALQQWFREAGGFTYSLDAPNENGTESLTGFLDEDNRVGYCEQFASAMAVMARTLGIPARVAVGFLSPDRVTDGLWEYSAHDMHAWPELYFPGSGWVRFEPTPAGRAEGVPGYTEADLPEFESPTSVATAQPSDDLPSRDAGPSADAEEDIAGTDGGVDLPWTTILVVGGVVLLLMVLLILPRAWRRSRRERRWRDPGGSVAAWAELRDVALDLGVPWHAGRSPRATGARLVEFFGAPREADAPERPRRGSGLAPEAVSALNRIVHAVELARYSRRAGTRDADTRDGVGLRDDVETCAAALADGAGAAARRRAIWWPRSLIGSRGRPSGLPQDEPSPTSPGVLVDHVGSGQSSSS